MYLPSFSQDAAFEDCVQSPVATLAKAQPQHCAVITRFVGIRGAHRA